MIDKTYCNTIDWRMLREQKAELIAVAHDGHPKLEGLVNILNDIQDYAVNELGFSERGIFGEEVI